MGRLADLFFSWTSVYKTTGKESRSNLNMGRMFNARKVEEPIDKLILYWWGKIWPRRRKDKFPVLWNTNWDCRKISLRYFDVWHLKCKINCAEESEHCQKKEQRERIMPLRMLQLKDLCLEDSDIGSLLLQKEQSEPRPTYFNSRSQHVRQKYLQYIWCAVRATFWPGTKLWV